MCHDCVTLVGGKRGDLLKHPPPLGCGDDGILGPEAGRGHLVQIARRARRASEAFFGTAGPHDRVQPAARIVRGGPRTSAVEKVQVRVLDDIVRDLGPVTEPAPGKRHQFRSKCRRVQHDVLRRSPAGHCVGPLVPPPASPEPPPHANRRPLGAGLLSAPRRKASTLGDEGSRRAAHPADPDGRGGPDRSDV